MSKYEGYNEGRKNAILKYRKEHLERLCLDLPKGTKEQWKEQAKTKGMSLSAYICWLIENDNTGEG